MYLRQLIEEVTTIRHNLYLLPPESRSFHYIPLPNCIASQIDIIYGLHVHLPDILQLELRDLVLSASERLLRYKDKEFPGNTPSIVYRHGRIHISKCIPEVSVLFLPWLWLNLGIGTPNHCQMSMFLSNMDGTSQK